MNILGEGYITIRSDGSKLASDVERDAQGGFAPLTAGAEAAGIDAGETLDAGVKDGLGKVEKDAEDSGGRAGGGFVSKLAGALSNLPGPLGSVGAKLDDVGAKASSMAGGLGGAGEDATVLGGAAGIATVGIGLLAAGVVAAAAYSVDLASKYQATTAQIAAGAGISQKAAKAIGDAFLTTAGTTTFGAQEIATAFAGVAGQAKALDGGTITAKASLDLMKASMDLAEASGTDLGSTTKAITGTLQSFGLTISSSPLVANILYNAANTTGQSVDSVSAALQRARSQMGAAAPDVSQLSALLVDLNDHGEKGRAAISALGTAFTGIIAPTTQVSYAQHLMGVNFLNAQGQLLPIGSIIAQLQPKLAGLSVGQQEATLKALGFGAASNKLLGVMNAGTAAFAQAYNSTTKLGSAHEAAEKRTDTLAGSLDKLKSIVEDLAIKIGEKLEPYVAEVAKDMADFAADVAKDWPTIQAVIATAIGFVKPLLQGFVLTIKGLLDVLSGIITFLKGIFTGHWSEAWQGLRKIFEGVWLAIQGEVKLAVGVLAKILDDAWRAIEGAVTTAWGSIVSFFEGIPGNLLSALSALGGLLLSWISAAWSGLTSWLGSAFGTMLAWWEAIPSDIITGLSAFAGLVLGWISAAWAGLTSWLAAGWATLLKWITGIPGAFISGLSSLGGLLLSWIETAWGNITTGISAGLTAAATFLAGVPGQIVAGLGDVASDLLGVGANIVSGILSGIQGAWDSIWSWIQGKLTGLVGKVLNFFGIGSPSKLMAEKVGGPIVDGIVMGMEKSAPGMVSSATGISQQLAGAISATGPAGLGVSGSSSSSTGGASIVNVTLAAGAVQITGHDPTSASSASAAVTTGLQTLARQLGGGSAPTRVALP